MPPFDPAYLNRETWSLTEAASILADQPPVPSQTFDKEPATGGSPAHNFANLKDATDAYLRGERGAHALPCEEARPIGSTQKKPVQNRRVRPWHVVQWAKGRGDAIPDALLTIPESTLRTATVQATQAALEPLESPPVRDSTTTTANEGLAELFDPVPVAALETMFPAGGKWAKWAERAASNGLKAARKGRATFNPYLAGQWFLTRGEPDWDQARLYRKLANSLPERSADSRELIALTGSE